MQTRSILLASVVVAAAAVTAAQDLVPQYPRTILIAFDPIIESEGGGRLHVVCGWNAPQWLSDNYSGDLQTASYGLMNYRRMQTVIADEFPLHVDGFRYTDEGYMTCYYAWSGWHMSGTDYKSQCRDFDLARKVDAGLVDEVLIQACPFTGYWESTMCGRGGYWCNSGPQVRIASAKIFIMMGFNYERGVGEMLEDYGHRSESILWHTYGDGTNTWTIFTRYDLVYPGEAACGNVHFAPNSESDYDWGNPRYVWSTCQDWLDNFPNLTGQKVWVNCSEWGWGDIRLHHDWWFAHMPHLAGTLNARLNNWWEYMQNFNAHSESGGDFPPGSPPPAAPYSAPQRVYTANDRDDWCPRISACGRIVWQGWDGADYEVYSSNLDGTNPVQITWNDFDDEAPQVNSSGRVVWQAHDGQDYEIFSANADGTGLVQITDNTVNDWHPQINNAGQIVWDHFDGQDYEVYSANADGTGMVQITNNSSSSGRPRDDVWPQINNANPARVVWFGWSGSNWEIYSANVDGTSLVNVSNNSREDEYPQINDAGRVVWQSYFDDTNAEIYSANAAGGNVLRLTTNTVEDWWPQINNVGRVVWMSRTGGDWEIYTRMADGSDAAQAITNNATPDVHPQIDDTGRIVWQGFDGHDWEIYLWYAGMIYQVSDNDYDDRWPVLGLPDVIAWHAESTPGATGRTTEIWAAGNGTLDDTSPTLVSVQPRGDDQVRVVLSEPVEATTAENPSNYALVPAVGVTGATLAPNERTVILDTTGFTSGTSYTLTINNVTDLAGNPIAPNTQATFEYVDYARATDGLVVLYDFDEGLGTIVHDVSQVGTPLNLNIGDPAAVQWVPGGLVLAAPVTIATSGYATKIYNACVPANEITLEAWAEPASTSQYGPAILMTMSSGYARNFGLGQGLPETGSGTRYNARLRTSTTGSGGDSLTTPPNQVTLALQHIVYTRTPAGTTTIYVDGNPVIADSVDGTFSNWSSTYRFAVGNEIAGGQPWLGELQLLAAYSRALSPAEVTQNYFAGPGGPPQIVPGDVNCDGTYGPGSFGDINPFVQLMTNPTAWQATYPGCPMLNGDINGDGSVDFGDINPFVALLSGA